MVIVIASTESIPSNRRIHSKKTFTKTNIITTINNAILIRLEQLNSDSNPTPTRLSKNRDSFIKGLDDMFFRFVSSTKLGYI